MKFSWILILPRNLQKSKNLSKFTMLSHKIVWRPKSSHSRCKRLDVMVYCNRSKVYWDMISCLQKKFHSFNPKFRYAISKFWKRIKILFLNLSSFAFMDRTSVYNHDLVLEKGPKYYFNWMKSIGLSIEVEYLKKGPDHHNRKYFCYWCQTIGN